MGIPFLFNARNGQSMQRSYCNAAECLKYATVQVNEIFTSLRTTLVNEQKSPGYDGVRGTLKI